MRVYIETYGCTLNKSDSELMETLLRRDFSISRKIEDSDVVVINTCSVKTPTEHKMLRRIWEITRMHRKPIVVAGCLAAAEPLKVRRISPNAVLVYPRSAAKIKNAVLSAFYGERADYTVYESKEISRDNCGIIASIPIAEGCTGKCTFCQTRIARGPLRSYSAGWVVGEVRRRVEKGAREIRLTAQDVGSFGKDSGEDLPSLIEKICAIEGEFMVRIGMLNPKHLAEDKSLLDIFKHEKVYKFLHLPVQSGSDKVLSDMGREYTVEEFEKQVDRFRRISEHTTLSTDIIAGYPTESNDDFERTIRLIERIRPEVVNISRYSHRLGTPASKLKELPKSTVAERSSILHKICTLIVREKNKELVGKRVRVLATCKKEGRTTFYRRAVFEEMKEGEFFNADVVHATKGALLVVPTLQ
ncbi:MAG: tRNA (N(6)-L-threonylcarbamoyladenosine(37)-C(2))-methylthiotransferase [Candidatus Micrarchaeia archaeon]